MGTPSQSAGPSACGRLYAASWGFLDFCTLLLLLVFTVRNTGAAQESNGVPVPPERPYTLHVYEDLVQVPSLVLDVHNQALGGLRSEDFNLRLDNGPSFHPRHSRLEGDDAVNYAFLIDTAPLGNTELVRGLKKAVEALPPGTFGEKDNIVVYAFDCHLVRSVREAATPEQRLQAGVEAVLRAPTLHTSSEPSRKCLHPVSLWDAAGAAILQMQNLPGRRVLVVISDGEVSASRQTWEEVRLAASVNSIAAFAMRPFWRPRPFEDIIVGRRAMHTGSENPLVLFCSGSGGLAMSDEADDVGGMLRRTLALVRSRYILEFPRAANSTGGLHALDVTVAKSGIFVRATGISVPLQDKTLLADPSTVPSDSSRSPVMGNRRILTPH